MFHFTVLSYSFTFRLNEAVKDWETCNLGRNNLRINHTDIVYTVYKQPSESLTWARTLWLSSSHYSFKAGAKASFCRISFVYMVDMCGSGWKRLKNVLAASLSSNFWFICFPEVQECGQRWVPHRHVHLGLAGLPKQPGRLHPAAHGGVSASGEAALSIRWVSALSPQKLTSAANKPTELPKGRMAAPAETSQVAEASLFIYTEQKHGCTTQPQFVTCDEMSAFCNNRR